MELDIYDYLHLEVEPDDKFCFVIMPFNERMNSIYTDGIVPAVTAAGYECTRADHDLRSVPIMFKIFDDIKKAKIVIADITASNPNVLYELGICHALKRNVILIKHEFDSSPPFDISYIRYHGYSDALSLRDKLINILHAYDQDGKKETQNTAAAKRLKKASDTYVIARESILTIEEFVEITLSIDSIKASDTELALLAYCAGHYGKFMRYACSLWAENETVVQTLVQEAASNSTTREPWRIGVMLEHCSDNIVKKYLGIYSGPIVNVDIFPRGIMDHKVVQILEERIDEPSISESVRNKLLQVRKQIKSEFEI